MRKAIKILSKKKLYEGHNSLYQYQFQLSGLSAKPLSKIISYDVLHCRDSVLILIYAPDIDSFLLLQEYRWGVFCNNNHDDPIIYECVAGEIDAGKTPEQAAQLETKEESGLEINEFVHITTAYASPGHITEKTYLYYSEVAGTPQTGVFGLEEEGEEMLTTLIKREEVYKMMDEMKIVDAMTLLTLYWFRSRDKRKTQ